MAKSLGTKGVPVTRELYTVDRLRAHSVYTLDGRRVPSVTTIIGLLDKPALVGWANRMGLEGIDIKKYVAHQADIGTVTHARIEAWLRDMDFDESNLDPEVIEKSTHGFNRFQSWWKDNCWEVEHVEMKLVSRKLQVGGRLDLIATKPLGARRVRGLLDIKSGSAIYREMKIQASQYAAMFEELHECDGLDDPRRIHEVWIIRTGKEEIDDIEPYQVMNRELCVRVFSLLAETYPLLARLR